jgi:hypothetical protein
VVLARFSTQAAGSALKILIGSIFIGAFMAFASAYLLKHRGLNRRPDLFFQTEILVVILFPYIAWMLAEAAHLSGIVSILFCGIVMAHYTTHNLHPWVTQCTAVSPRSVFGICCFATSWRVHIASDVNSCCGLCYGRIAVWLRDSLAFSRKFFKVLAFGCETFVFV